MVFFLVTQECNVNVIHFEAALLASGLRQGSTYAPKNTRIMTRINRRGYEPITRGDKK